MWREDEYRQLANNVRKRAGDEESAVMRAQWEILACTYVRLRTHQSSKEPSAAQRRSMTPGYRRIETFSSRGTRGTPGNAIAGHRA